MLVKIFPAIKHILIMLSVLFRVVGSVLDGQNCEIMYFIISPRIGLKYTAVVPGSCNTLDKERLSQCNNVEQTT